MWARALDHVFADHSGVHGGAASAEDNPVDVAQIARSHVQAAQHGGGVLPENPAAERIGDAGGLLVDFLEHEVRESPFFRLFLGEGDLLHLKSRFPAALQGADLEVGRGQFDQIVVVQVNRVAGVGDQGGDVAGDEIFAFAQTDHQG